MSRKRPTTQRSKGRGSHGAKARYWVHARCCNCGRHQPVRRLDANRLCVLCARGAYSPPA
jgi:RNA polymerase-binding transcription factor DksA